MASMLIMDDAEQVHAVLRGIVDEAGYMVVVTSDRLLCSITTWTEEMSHGECGTLGDICSERS
jgi:hypothetical protein